VTLLLIVKEVAPFTLRRLEPNDEAILYEMLYQAIFVPEGGEPPAREIVYQPQLSKYVKDFGKVSDRGYVAFDNKEPIGATWLRLLSRDNKGYGYVNDETPELTIAVMPGYQGQGIGTALLEHLFKEAKENYQSISLSVWRENPVYRLYQRLGFETIKQNENDVVMLKRL
jgi:ribosomal protein S18 acetylase RimI-like enzyme